MSRTIKDSITLLSETLDNCKTALTEKGVTDVEAIKISDIDEKIAEIQSGATTDNVITELLNEYSYCLVLVKGYLNNNDYSTAIDENKSKVGENLDQPFNRGASAYKVVNWTYSIYAVSIRCTYKKLQLIEYQEDDYGDRSEGVCQIDISTPGLVFTEMTRG